MTKRRRCKNRIITGDVAHQHGMLRPSTNHLLRQIAEPTKKPHQQPSKVHAICQVLEEFLRTFPLRCFGCKPFIRRQKMLLEKNVNIGKRYCRSMGWNLSTGRLSCILLFGGGPGLTMSKLIATWYKRFCLLFHTLLWYTTTVETKPTWFSLLGLSHDLPAIAGEMWHLGRGKRMRFKNSFRNPRTIREQQFFFFRPSLTDLTSLVGRFPRQMKACSDRFSDKSQVPL